MLINHEDIFHDLNKFEQSGYYFIKINKDITKEINFVYHIYFRFKTQKQQNLT
jgi:hypothetical protein